MNESEYRQFTGEPDDALERWLGTNFVSWVPSRRELIINPGRGEWTVRAGDWLKRDEWHRLTHWPNASGARAPDARGGA